MNNENKVAERLRWWGFFTLTLAIVVPIILFCIEAHLSMKYETKMEFPGYLIGILVGGIVEAVACFILAEIISLLHENNNLLKTLIHANSSDTDSKENNEKIFSDVPAEPAPIEYDETLPTI